MTTPRVAWSHTAASDASSLSSSSSTASSGKSPAEVATLGRLRQAYDLLAEPTRSPLRHRRRPPPTVTVTTATVSSGTPRAREQRGGGGVVERVRSLQRLRDSTTGSDTEAPADLWSSGPLVERWLGLETVVEDLEADRTTLRREIERCEAQGREIHRLPVDLADLEPRWQVLCELLGTGTFEQYVADLFAELAALRREFSLYNERLRHFQDAVRLRCIGHHAIQETWAMDESLDILNAGIQSIEAERSLLLSNYPVLTHHCLDPTATNRFHVTGLADLLERFHPARERLARLCFEQLGDGRRGDGLVPPPDRIRSHRLLALAKQSHTDARCSREELDEIHAWLEARAGDDITMTAFVGRHLHRSDRHGTEDAEFVSYLMRMWQFDVARATTSKVLTNYEMRGHLVAAKRRKEELVKKIERVIDDALPTKLAVVRASIQELPGITIERRPQFDLLDRHASIASSMTLRQLCELHLVDLALTEFPSFVVELPNLRVLDLSTNRLRGAPLPVALSRMTHLRRLVLAGNALSDCTFPTIEDAWEPLKHLEVLDLRDNGLTAFPLIISGLRGLRELIIAENRLRGDGVSPVLLDRWRDHGPQELRVLDLRRNQLTAISERLGELVTTSLERLFVQDNKLTAIPSSWLLMHQIQEFSFAHNLLRACDHDLTLLLTRCTGLRELAFDHNRLRTWTITLGGPAPRFPGIKAIRLHRNRLRSLELLPHGVFEGCEELELQENHLSELPDAFFDAFPGLQVCRLQKNRLSSLPTSLAHCRDLRVLEAHGNAITDVPLDLCELRQLNVLNLRDNQLSTIPSAWCRFAEHEETGTRRRVLQTLLLQKNPLRNKVLKALADGHDVCDGPMGIKATVGGGDFKSSETKICEMYIRKLIDGVKQSVPVLAMERAVHREEEDEEMDSDGEDGECGIVRRRWKGRARYVIKYIERQLQAHMGGARPGLEVSCRQFAELLQRLHVASTQRELQVMTERFRTPTAADRVDGLAFLRAVETMGLFNALRSTAGASNSGHKLVVDGVASILQFLRIMHAAKETREAGVRAATASVVKNDQPRPQQKTSKTTTSAKAPTATIPQPRPHSARPRRSSSTKATSIVITDTHERHATAAAFRQRRDPTSQRERELERQRQRIAILEQQLMDRQLLELSCRPASTSGGAFAGPQQSAMVRVRVRLVGAAPEESDLVALSLPVDRTVLELKLQLEQRFRVGTRRQVLLGHRSRDHRKVRLRDEAVLAEYVGGSSVGGGGADAEWRVELLVSEQLGGESSSGNGRGGAS